MSEATSPTLAAASVLFNLPEYRAADAVDGPGAQCQVLIEGVWSEAAFPDCGVLSARVRQRTLQRLRDVPVAGPVEVVLVKRRFACTEAACGRRTFVEVSDEVPARARVTSWLRAAVLDAVIGSERVVAEVAAAHGVSWWTVQKAVNTAADVLTDPDNVAETRLGIDEHRYRSICFYREQARSWARFEPWMTAFVNVDSGRVLGVVDGRDSAGVGAWLAARSVAWREAVEVVAIDPFAAFRRALRELGAPPACGGLPRAVVSVDAFHLVKLANDTVTRVRQRVAREAKGRRGVDPA